MFEVTLSRLKPVRSRSRRAQLVEILRSQCADLSLAELHMLLVQGRFVRVLVPSLDADLLRQNGFSVELEEKFDVDRLTTVQIAMPRGFDFSVWRTMIDLGAPLTYAWAQHIMAHSGEFICPSYSVAHRCARLLWEKEVIAVLDRNKVKIG